jgi:hypothetical protein
MATTETATKSLARKLAEVMGAVKSIPKTGKNTFHNYTYATETDIVAAVRKELSERAVLLVPSVQKVEWSERQTKSGAKKVIATLFVSFTFYDGDSDARISFDVCGQGEDEGDKCTNKALTSAVKYALLKVFLIPTGDDVEDDGDEVDEEQERKARARSIWALAQKKGCTEKEWPTWVANVLGAKKAPTAWTDDDMAKLEKAFTEMGDPGPAPGKPATTAPATPASQTVDRKARVTRIWKLAEAKGCKASDFAKWISGVLGAEKKSESWTEDDMSQLEVAFAPEPGHGG